MLVIGVSRLRYSFAWGFECSKGRVAFAKQVSKESIDLELSLVSEPFVARRPDRVFEAVSQDSKAFGGFKGFIGRGIHLEKSL